MIMEDAMFIQRKIANMRNWDMIALYGDEVQEIHPTDDVRQLVWSLIMQLAKNGSHQINTMESHKEDKQSSITQKK